MEITINKITYWKNDESSFNTLFSFLKTHSSVRAFGINSIYKITKNLWQFSYNTGEIKYYKFGPIFNDANDKTALEKRLGFEFEIAYTRNHIKCVIDIIKDIFPIENEVKFIRASNQEITVHNLRFVRDYLDILGGKYPGYGIKLLLGDDSKSDSVAKIVNQLLSDQIKSLELTIKNTEDTLVIRKRQLAELKLKQSINV